MGMFCPCFQNQTCSLVTHYWLIVFVLVLLSPLPSVSNVEINAVSFQLPPPPFLSGSLATNNVLTEAERLHEGMVSAPGSFVVHGDDIFTVTKDGQVVNVAPCRPAVVATLSPRGCRTTKECGYLISIKINAENMLMVLDAYRGLFEVNPKTGLFRHVYNSNTIVNGRASIYLNDMAYLPGGVVVMSDSSPTFDHANEFWIRFEGRPDGRLLGFNTASGLAQELFTGLAYPTGLEVTSEGRELLVAEAGRARILRLELVKEKLNLRSTFNFNLPGMPEHIRRTKQGTYWVGLTYPRFQGEVSIMDQYSDAASSRNFLARRRHVEQLILMYTRKGMAVELDRNGNVVSSIHDADGLRVKDVCEVVEADGILYVGTKGQNAVLRVVKLARDLTVTSSLQVLRSRCQVSEEQLGAAKAALEQQQLARKGTPEYSHILASILSANNFNIVLQNYLRQQQTALAASSHAARGQQAANSPSPPRNRLDSIRQGLTKLQNTLQNKRPAILPPQGKNPMGQPPNLMGNSNLPQSNVQNIINEDPFLPPGMSPLNLISPLRNIPQSDTTVQGHNSGAGQISPSSPFVVHRMENGQMVTHVLVGNDFKINDQVNGQQMSPKPTIANRTSAFPTFMPTLAPPVRISESDVAQINNRPQPALQSQPLPMTRQQASQPKLQEPPGSIGGFFDLLNGVAGLAKVKETTQLEETTPSVPLPDHVPIIHAENPYILGPSHSEAHNYTPSDFGVSTHSNNSVITQSKKINVDPNQMFHPAQRIEPAQHSTQSPMNSAKSSFLRQGFQMLQQYLEQSKTAQSRVEVVEATPRNFSNTKDISVVFLNNRTVADPSLTLPNQTRMLPGNANQELLSSVPSLEKVKDLLTTNGMLKDAQQLSYSSAASIHPMQPINDVAAEGLSPLVNNLPATATTQQPQAVNITESEGGTLTSYIKIVQGPGKYILIPLTQTTLLQALRGVASNDNPNSGVEVANAESRQQKVPQVQPRDGPVERMVSNQDWPSSRSGMRIPVATDGANRLPSMDSSRRYQPTQNVRDDSRQTIGPFDIPSPQQLSQNMNSNGPTENFQSQSRLESVNPTQMWPTNNENNPPPQSWSTNNQNNPPPQSRSTNYQNNSPPQSWSTNNQNNPAPQSWSTNNQNNPPTQSWSTNNQNNPPTQSWSTNNQNNPPPQSWSFNNQNNPPTQSWPNNNQNNPPTQSWSTNNQNNPPTQSWSTNNQNIPPTQSWSTSNQNIPPTQSWSTSNQNNPPTQSWSTSNQNNPPTQSWSTNDQNIPPTQSWSTNNQNIPPTQSWSTSNQPTQPQSIQSSASVSYYTESAVEPTQRTPTEIPRPISSNPTQPSPVTEESFAASPPPSPQLTWPANTSRDFNATASSDGTPLSGSYNGSTAAAQDSQLKEQAYVTQWQVPAN